MNDQTTLKLSAEKRFELRQSIETTIKREQAATECMRTRKFVEGDNPHYDPGMLLDTLMRLLGVRNDYQLARRLIVAPSQICKIRKRQVSVAPSLLISMHEETNLSLRQLRALMGDYRESTSPSAGHPIHPQLQFLAGARSFSPRLR